MSCRAHLDPVRRRVILGDTEWAGRLEWMRTALRQGAIASHGTDGRRSRTFDPALRRFVASDRRPLASSRAPS